jgi:hypothetical protein
MSQENACLDASLFLAARGLTLPARSEKLALPAVAGFADQP